MDYAEEAKFYAELQEEKEYQKLCRPTEKDIKVLKANRRQSSRIYLVEFSERS